MKEEELIKGTWKRDPRGVEYITFTMPNEISVVEERTFYFETPKSQQQCHIRIKNVDEVLGIIVLMRPNYGKD